MLIYGHLRATRTGHVVELKLLRVANKRILGMIVDEAIPVADAAHLALLANNLYRRLTAT
jgi:hypothetical protein